MHTLSPDSGGRSQRGLPTAADTPSKPVTLANLGAFLKQSLWLLVAAVVIAMLVGAVYVATTVPTFVASAQLLIESQKMQFFWKEAGMVDLTVDNAQVESQLEILKSEKIAGAVIDSLNLVADPEFGTPKAGSDFERRRFAIAAFRDRFSARRVGQSYIIEISFRSRDAAKAPLITNAVADAYIRDQLQAKSEVAKQADTWMQQRITELGAQLNDAARAVQRFKAKAGILDTGTQNGDGRLIDQLTELEARAQSYRRLYETFLQKLTENLQQESYPVSNARVVAEATRPLGRSAPKTTLVMALSVLLGLICGSGLAAVRWMLDRTIRGVSEACHAVGLDLLGALPGSPGISGAERAPSSRCSDALRDIIVSLDVALQWVPQRCVGISAVSGDDKTTVAVGLAQAYAASGSHVLLIDNDFRESAVSQRFAPHAKYGLLQMLRGQAGDALTVDSQSGFSILPIAEGDRVARSEIVLASTEAQALLARLRGSFDVILINLPALDARVAGRFLDGVVIVANWGKTSIDGLKTLVDMLRTGGAPLPGLVVDGVREGEWPSYEEPLAAARRALRWLLIHPFWQSARQAAAHGRRQLAAYRQRGRAS